MPSQKNGLTKGDLKIFKDEIVHQFHVVSEGVIDQMKLVAEGVASVNEKLDRRFNELKTEIQETRQEVLAAVIFPMRNWINALQPSKRNPSNSNTVWKK